MLKCFTTGAGSIHRTPVVLFQQCEKLSECDVAIEFLSLVHWFGANQRICLKSVLSAAVSAYHINKPD
ncbi:MAG: hypothetical protein CME31_24215 [Gimesia sp.]|uniref:Uncharacterized protein n=1 Tax=Gimesia maris TaxID=122 RepID=A0A3D3REJ8_9PLAN|nr:hypothetical protein [Gimesia sp.]HCO27269.1 hypothetical protein [Gimesia maris]